MTNPPKADMLPASPTEIEQPRAGMIEDGVRQIDASRRSEVSRASSKPPRCSELVTFSCMRFRRNPRRFIS